MCSDFCPITNCSRQLSCRGHRPRTLKTANIIFQILPFKKAYFKYMFQDNSRKLVLRHEASSKIERSLDPYETINSDLSSPYSLCLVKMSLTKVVSTVTFLAFTHLIMHICYHNKTAFIKFTCMFRGVLPSAAALYIGCKNLSMCKLTHLLRHAFLRCCFT